MLSRQHTHMNYHGTWVHAGNYGRILLVGDIFVNSIIPSLQRECEWPIDAVYADSVQRLRELAEKQMQRFSYALVLICEGGLDGSASAILPSLRGRYAKSRYILLTAPPAWLKSAKYRQAEPNDETANAQCRKVATEHQLPCMDLEALALQYGLQSQDSACYPRRYLVHQELCRFHFSKIRKIRKADATENGRRGLVLRFLAIKIAETIKKCIGSPGHIPVLWDNLQAHEKSPFLLIGDSNMRLIRSNNQDLRKSSDIFSSSADLLEKSTQEQIMLALKPHHKVIGICYGTHHLSEHYSDAFENELRELFLKLGQDSRKLVAINVLARATEHSPYRPDEALNRTIRTLNLRFEKLAKELNIPYLDAYALMEGKTFEDKVHYEYKDYTGLSAQVYHALTQQIKN